MSYLRTDVDANGLDWKLERAGAWSGVAWLVMIASSYGVSGLVPVLSPATSAVDLAAFVSDHKYRILIGMMLFLIGSYTFMMTWALTLGERAARQARSCLRGRTRSRGVSLRDNRSVDHHSGRDDPH